jgi:DnaK suppressor protein
MTITAEPAHQQLGTMLRERHRAATEQFESQVAAATALRGNGFESGDAADLGSQAAGNEQLDMVTAALHQQVLRLQDALDRHEAGTFGRCQGCGASIPVERLEIMPWVTHCVPCQERADRR